MKSDALLGNYDLMNHALSLFHLSSHSEIFFSMFFVVVFLIFKVRVVQRSLLRTKRALHQHYFNVNPVVEIQLWCAR